MFHQVPRWLSEELLHAGAQQWQDGSQVRVPGIWDPRCPWWQLAVMTLWFEFCAKFALSSGWLDPLREEDVLAQRGVSPGFGARERGERTPRLWPWRSQGWVWAAPGKGIPGRGQGHQGPRSESAETVSGHGSHPAREERGAAGWRGPHQGSASRGGGGSEQGVSGWRQRTKKRQEERGNSTQSSGRKRWSWSSSLGPSSPHPGTPGTSHPPPSTTRHSLWSCRWPPWPWSSRAWWAGRGAGPWLGPASAGGWARGRPPLGTSAGCRLWWSPPLPGLQRLQHHAQHRRVAAWRPDGAPGQAWLFRPWRPGRPLCGGRGGRGDRGGRGRGVTGGDAPGSHFAGRKVQAAPSTGVSSCVFDEICQSAFLLSLFQWGGACSSQSARSSSLKFPVPLSCNWSLPHDGIKALGNPVFQVCWTMENQKIGKECSMHPDHPSQNKLTNSSPSAEAFCFWTS